MGIDLAIAQNLLNLSQRVKFQGRILTLRRQKIHASPDELRQVSEHSGRLGMEFPWLQLVDNNMYAEPFFKMLGFNQVESLDASRYENCTHEHSLDKPIPGNLRAVFDFVFDGGTSEHIFDLPSVYENVFNLLKKGGYFYSVCPANGYFGHGFYQFGPEVPWTVWKDACGFDVVESLALPKDASILPIPLPDPAVVKSRVEPELPSGKVYLCYTVQKTANAAWKRRAQQSDYVSMWSKNATPATGSKPAGNLDISPFTEEEFEQAIAENNSRSLFPVKSQTIAGDRLFLLSVIDLMRKRTNGYSFLEVGSFLGGSLAPFLLDTKCTSITSVDDRGKIQQDERGLKFDYTAFSTDAMLENLANANLPVDKLSCFDGPIGEFKGEGGFDLVHIDAIHTDEAVFEDFLACRRLMKKSGVVLFHDYDLVFKGVEMVRILLESQGIDHAIAIRPNSLFCAIFLENYSIGARDIGDISENGRNERIDKALKKRILDQFSNRSFVATDSGDVKFEIPDRVFIGLEETREIPSG